LVQNLLYTGSFFSPGLAAAGRLGVTIRKDSEDIQNFERRSATYERSLAQILFLGWIHRAAPGAVPAGFIPDSLVDIGCGTGRLLRKMAARWPSGRLTGVDPAEGMVNEACCLTPNSEFIVSLAESLPLPNGYASLVISTVSFHHWQDQSLGVQQAARVLKPGGLFILADISLPFGLHRLFRHGTQPSLSTLRGMFTSATQASGDADFGYDCNSGSDNRFWCQSQTRNSFTGSIPWSFVPSQ
jgi:ubiquinone/menaquinone biosynthesis C-methylase UbiE